MSLPVFGLALCIVLERGLLWGFEEVLVMGRSEDLLLQTPWEVAFTPTVR